MGQVATSQKSSDKNLGFIFSITVTILHAGYFFSWIILRGLRSDLSFEELTSLFSQYWVIPNLIGLRGFIGVLIILSVAAVIILGRLGEKKNGSWPTILLVTNIVLILLSGWSLL